VQNKSRESWHSSSCKSNNACSLKAVGDAFEYIASEKKYSHQDVVRKALESHQEKLQY
jgi:hypothetical protein